MVGKRLEQLRCALEFETQRDFAKALKVGEDRYTSWERGKNKLPPDQAVKLLEKYGVSLDWLYGGRMDGLPSRLRAKIEGDTEGRGRLKLV